jgi:hypothetical protein
LKGGPGVLARHRYTLLALTVKRKTNSKSAVRHDYSTPALEKGLDILELFASTPGGLTVSEAARMLNRTVSEIFRMLGVFITGSIINSRQEGKIQKLSHA